MKGNEPNPLFRSASPGPPRPLMKFHFQDVKAYQQITEDLDVIYVYKSCLPNDTQISAIL